MSEWDNASRLNNEFLSLLQNHEEALLNVRNEIIQARGASSERDVQNELDKLFETAGEELNRTHARYEQLGRAIRAPRARLRAVK